MSDRRSAVECLIDIDRNGAAFRRARVLNSLATASQHGRANKIPDFALFDKAKGLSCHEITMNSPEMMELYQVCSSSESYTDNKEGDAMEENCDGDTEIREGWQDRVLKHHDKIIRAKNHTNPVPIPNQAATGTAVDAVPPPQLISALRHIFGTPSCDDLRVLLEARDETAKSQTAQTSSTNVNVLPSLLQAVLNHSMFNKLMSPASDVKRDWKTMFDLSTGKATAGDCDGEATDTVNESVSENLIAAMKAEGQPNGPLPAPPAANMESILSNLCRDQWNHRGNNCSRAQGLLIAALSIMAEYMLCEEDLDQLQAPAPVPLAESSLEDADPFTQLLQVGAILPIFSRHPSNGITDAFELDKDLLDYFVKASSTYEERIEIQKASLFKRQNSPAPPAPAYSTPPPLDLRKSPVETEEVQNIVSEDHSDGGATDAAGQGNESIGDDSDNASEGEQEDEEGSAQSEEYEAAEDSMTGAIESDDENDDGDYEDELQQALALSLAAAIGSGDSASDSDQTEDGGDDRGESDLSHKTSVSETEDSADNLPALPKIPSASLLPKFDRVDTPSDEESKPGLCSSPCATFEPSSLACFGQVPASHVLVHLLREIQTRLLDNEAEDTRSHFFAADTASSMTDEELEASSSTNDDSVTASLLIALLQICNQLRQSSVAALRNSLHDMEDEVDGKFAAVELSTLDDPESMVALDALEAKGMKRKAADAHDYFHTKTKLAGIWTKRVEFYSSCCFAVMQSLRTHIGNCTTRGQESPIIVSDRTRLQLSTVLTMFYSSSASTSAQSIHELTKCHVNNESTDFHSVSLCNEAIRLWGALLPLLHPGEEAKKLLHDSVRQCLSSPDPVLLCDAVAGDDDGTWDKNQVESCKLDLLCKRLRASDMLDIFVASPMTNTSPGLEAGVSPGSIEPLLSDLGTFVEMLDGSVHSNATRLYLAITQRAISSLILWNDLAMTSSDANDHEISGGDSASTTAGSWTGGLQLKLDQVKFHFDPSKCAGSISVKSSDGSPSVTANQRATKAWGSALSSTAFQPKTGVHKWAVKLDQCERGHIFVGVATSRANLKTYIGGDGNGWGLIGTQALWHDRNKIRGDYGKTFRTGATIILTLDTNAGTLRFGLLKESTSSSVPISPQSNFASPRASRAVPPPTTTTVEDWGIAFEGLPMDVKLHPAVGLYQRDDKATLYTIPGKPTKDSGKTGSPSSGDVYFPVAGNVDKSRKEHQSLLHSWNMALCSDGIAVASRILLKSIDLLESMDETSQVNNVLLVDVLPALASSICLVPSCLPVAPKYAGELMPLVTKCAKVIDDIIWPGHDNGPHSAFVYPGEGSWTISVDEQSGSESSSDNIPDEYSVRLKCDSERASDSYSTLHGEIGTSGASKPDSIGLALAAANGTHFQMLEEWCPGDGAVSDELTFDECARLSTTSCIINARLNLDGKQFKGIRYNVQKKTIQRITGVCDNSTVVEKLDMNTLLQTESLLCLAAGHLSLALCSSTSMLAVGDVGPNEDDMDESTGEMLKSLLRGSSILSLGLMGGVNLAVNNVREICCLPHGKISDIARDWQETVYTQLLDVSTRKPASLTTMDELASIVQEHLGPDQPSCSFSSLCPEGLYASTQLCVASSILYHSQDFAETIEEITISAADASRQIMDTAIRLSLLRVGNKVSRREACKIRCEVMAEVAEFLLGFPHESKNTSVEQVVNDISSIFSTVASHTELAYLRRELDIATERGLLRSIGMRSMQFLIRGEEDGIKCSVPIESALASLPRMLKPLSRPPGAGDSAEALSLTGCASGVQHCIFSSMDSIFGVLDAILNKDAAREQSTSLIYCILACHFTAVEKTNSTISTAISSLRGILSRHDWAKRDLLGEEVPAADRMVNMAHHQDNLRLLKVSSSLLLSLSAQCSTLEACSSMLDLLLDEIARMCLTLREEETSKRKEKGIETLNSDAELLKAATANAQGRPKRSEKDNMSTDCMAYLTTYGAVFSKSTVPPREQHEIFISSLLDAIHAIVGMADFAGPVSKRSHQMLSLLGLSDEDCGDSSYFLSLPLKFQRRMMRLLRPILLSMDASATVTRRVLVMCQAMWTEHINMNLGESAVALLRYLFTFSSDWRASINECLQRATNASEDPTIFCGVLAYLGGLPQTLADDAFVVIEGEASSSSSSSAPNKLRGGSPSGLPTGSVSTPNPVEDVISGLSRHDALSGVVTSIDTRTGSCDVVVLGDRSSVQIGPRIDSSRDHQHDKVTIRAMRVGAGNLSAVNELPLTIDGVCGLEVFSPLLNTMKLVTSCIKEDVRAELDAAELKVMDLSVTDLMTCGMGLRAVSTTISDPRILARYLNDEASTPYFANALLLGSAGLRCCDGLDSLSSFEARLWHVISTRKEVKTRLANLSSASGSELESFAGNEEDARSQEDAGKTAAPKKILKASTRAKPSSNLMGRALRSREASGTASREEDDTDESTSASGRSSSGRGERSGAAAAHLREAALIQMAELGLPRQWAELALDRVGGANIEQAVHFCLERSSEMESLISEEAERSSSSSSSVSRRSGSFGVSRMASANLLRQLEEMGFPRHWCVEALSATRNNVDEALTWILTNGDRLSAEDEAGREDEDDGEHDSDEGSDQDDIAAADDDVDDDDDEDDEGKENALDASTEERKSGRDNHESEIRGWTTNTVCPVRFVSGRSSIDPKTFEITGLPSGGFSSVGTKGVMLTSGKWYYEAEIQTAGCLQIGWADASFAGHCQAERGDGCGDGPSSWAFDGWRRYRWHSTATEWGCRWTEGDIVGCLVDMDDKVVSFTLNGQGEEIGMGVAFSGEGFRPCGGVYACVSFNRREKIRLILGGEGSESFKHPPAGYRGIGEAVLDAVKERDALLQNESLLDDPSSMPTKEAVADKYICDFSEGEHGHELFSWPHRYFNADASVHLGSTSRSSLLGTLASRLGSSKNSSLSQNVGGTTVDIRSRLSDLLKSKQAESSKVISASAESNVEFMKMLYETVREDLDRELKEVLASLCVLYSQKLLLHLFVSRSDQFDISLFVPTLHSPWESPGTSEIEASRCLWRVLEHSASLQSSGWVGEAGSMAVAAETLGLNVSTGDRKAGSMPGFCATKTGERILLPCGGVSKHLAAAFLPDTSSEPRLLSVAMSFAACSEMALGNGNGGTTIFIRRGLQNAAATSSSFRDVLVAAVRKSVRQLAAIDFEGDEKIPEDGDTVVQTERKQMETSYSGNPPDARLSCFLTGMLLSENARAELSPEQDISLKHNLFEGWCVGLLSASVPFRMICASTASGILNTCPSALGYAISNVPLLAKYFARLQSTVSRRVWAERASLPICSKYSQALVELLTSVKRSSPAYLSPQYVQVDSATPLPLPMPPPSTDGQENGNDEMTFWEEDEGWTCCDGGWEVWTGAVEIMEVEWKPPTRSSVRTLMDGGEGPPFLRKDHLVIRGKDWSYGDDDGSTLYEQDKKDKVEKRDEEERAEEERLAAEAKAEKERLAAEAKAEADRLAEQMGDEDDGSSKDTRITADAIADNPALDPGDDDPARDADADDGNIPEKKKLRKPAPSKLPLGTVLSVEPWDGVPAMARRVRWHLTGNEGIYRYGGDGGCFDVIHVEANDKGTRVKKKHHLPETAEQCAARYGFGKRRTCNVLLRLRRPPSRPPANEDLELRCDGILEWPDFGAGILVDVTFYPDGAVFITEKRVLYGSKDSGWEVRFGQSSFVPGTVFEVSPTASTDIYSTYDELLGSNSSLIEALRNKADGGRVRVTYETRLFRSKVREESSLNALDGTLSHQLSSHPPPICFDPQFHAPSMTLSKDKRSVTCTSSDGRGVAFGNVGFTKGVHYWEVKLEKAEVGSVFIGVAEKPGCPSGSSPQTNSYGFESQVKLNRWLGWGFVNFRATYSAGTERVYGAHCHAGDTVGVQLDCDAGRLSFYFDGVKYGEHILSDLGCAYENISPFGFNADGCGTGGSGQGAPSGHDGIRSSRNTPANGAVRPKSLWPVIGLRHPGDRVTISSKWNTSKGVDGITVVQNVLKVDGVLGAYEGSAESFPKWFVEEAFQEFQRWKSDRWTRSATRGALTSTALDVYLDTSPFACAAACASIGLPIVFLPGDRVDVKRSAGRILELQEEAIILGVYQGRLYYRLVLHKSEGGSLTEGGGRAFYWDESEAVEGGLRLVGEGLGRSIPLPKLEKFVPTTGGLKIIYPGGAVVRSDLEIFDGSVSLGTIPNGAIIPPEDVIERRINSCGVVRFLVTHDVGRGWISQRIRGGDEEEIIEILPADHNMTMNRYIVPEDSARAWHETYISELSTSQPEQSCLSLDIDDLGEFETLLDSGIIDGLDSRESDGVLSKFYGGVSDDLQDCSFTRCAQILSHVLGQESHTDDIDPVAHEITADALSHVIDKLPSIPGMMARISMLRAFNKRARFALPWLPLKSAQESGLFGGLSGFGKSLETVGRNWDAQSEKDWAQIPSISARLRSCRQILFGNVKKEFFGDVLDATSTPTSLAHDEYELPREVRTVRVNRLKARRAMASGDNTFKKKHCVFSQLRRELRGWSGAALRRSFVAKGHGGQKRAFKVKLVGEGVNDYSGPYREVFTDAIHEVTALDQEGRSCLGIMQPTANGEGNVGEGRDLFVFANVARDNAELSEQVDRRPISEEEATFSRHFSCAARCKSESSREVDDTLLYLGKLVGVACRHGLPLDLPLPLGTVWKQLAREGSVNMKDALREIDILAFKQAGNWGNDASDELLSQTKMLNYFAEGMALTLPIELLSLFGGEQLREIVCGNPEIDVELLQRVVEYEGYTGDEEVIGYFWETLREMTTSERKLFLQFVWARNRLPMKESGFDAPFKIQKDAKSADDGDYPLPSASTCFFSLSLPEYPSKEVLREKLLFAIENVTTMESDYVTNDAELGEGWQPINN